MGRQAGQKTLPRGKQWETRVQQAEPAEGRGGQRERAQYPDGESGGLIGFRRGGWRAGAEGDSEEIPSREESASPEQVWRDKKRMTSLPTRPMGGRDGLR
jgi:hypothetical protein